MSTKEQSGKVIALAAEAREVSGKRGAARVRKEGRIPAVVYGRTEPIAVSVDEQEFTHQFRHVSENTLIDLNLKKETRHVIIKDYDMDTLTRHVLHLDFLEIEKGKMLRTHIPIVPVGSSVGVRSGGVFDQQTREIEIECLPKDLPSQIEVDISALDAGDSIHVSDLSIPEGVNVISSPDMILCHVAAVREVIVESEEEEEEEDASSSEDADE